MFKELKDSKFTTLNEERFPIEKLGKKNHIEMLDLKSTIIEMKNSWDSLDSRLKVAVKMGKVSEIFNPKEIEKS